MMPLVELSSALVPHFHLGILPALAAAAPVIGSIGTAAAGGAALINAFKGGGGGGGGSASAMPPADYFALYGSQAAAANVPLTMAALRFAQTTGATTGALGQYVEGLSSGQKTILKDAAQDSSGARASQMAEVMGMLDKGQNLAEETGRAKLGLELLNPTFAAKAGSEALNRDNRLAEALGSTNLGIQAAQEGAKLNIAQKYGDTLSSLLQTRAGTEGLLAQGAQRIAGALALNDASVIGDLTRNQSKVKGDLARIRANTAATKDLRRNAMGIAMSGQNFFA